MWFACTLGLVVCVCSWFTVCLRPKTVCLHPRIGDGIKAALSLCVVACKHVISHKVVTQPSSCVCTCADMQDVSAVFMLLAMPNAELRSSAAVVVVNLLGDQGREAMEAAAERLKVGWWVLWTCMGMHAWSSVTTV